MVVQVAEAVETSEVVPAETAVAAGTVEVAEVEAAGSVEVAEAFGRRLLCASAGGAACSRVSAACFVVPAPFSVAALS